MHDLDKLISETTDCDFKVELEEKKPKSWLKSVSAFANSFGGSGVRMTKPSSDYLMCNLCPQK